MDTVRILAVDDQEFNLDLIEVTFADCEEVLVVRAQNGREALERLENEEPFHVILLDLAMPLLSGIDTLKILQQDRRFSQIPTIVVTANSEEKHTALEAGATDFLSKPYDIEELKLRTLNYARLRTYQNSLARSKERLEETVLERTRELRDALRLARETEYEISTRLGRASEFRDLETGMHIKRMSRYSAKLAELSGMASEEVELILYASPLHDIGKVGIPDRILLKPGRLSEAEFELMQRHTTFGGEILAKGDDYPVIRAGRIIAMQHHEKYDGSGYPGGLKGEAIHIYGRIVAIADVFDALSSDRVYKPAFTIEKSLEIMREGRGSHFDPRLIDLFFEYIDDFLAIRASFPDDERGPRILELAEAKEKM